MRVPRSPFPGRRKALPVDPRSAHTARRTRGVQAASVLVPEVPQPCGARGEPAEGDAVAGVLSPAC